MKIDRVRLIRKHFGNDVSQKTLSNAIVLLEDFEHEIRKQLNLHDVRQSFEKNQIVVYKTKIPAVINEKIANGFYILKDQKGNDIKVHETKLEKAKINIA